MGTYPWQVRLTLFVVAIGGYAIARYSKVLVGKDNRLSTSKTVTYAWTLFVVWVFLVLTVVNVTADAEVPIKPVSDEYLMLLGGPFLALVAAKGIVTSRLSNGTLQKSDAQDYRITDLLTNDKGNADLVDLQFTLFNAVALLWAAAHFIEYPLDGLPALPAGLAALTSVSALTYIGNKAVNQNTPRITSLSPSVAGAGDEVTIRGARLVPPARPGEPVEPPVITVDGLLVPHVGARPLSESEVTFAVPGGVQPGDVDVTVSSGSGPSGAGSASVKLRVL